LTIKIKLIANALVVAAIVTALSLAAFLDAGVGIIYLYNDAKKQLQPAATYAVSLAERPENGVLKPGEGLVGQVAIELSGNSASGISGRSSCNKPMKSLRSEHECLRNG